MPVADVARVYFELGVALGLDWLHGEIDRLAVDGSWQATARTGLRDAAMRAHRELTQQVLRTRGAKRVGERSSAGARSAAKRSPAGSARSPRCARWARRISPRSPWAWTRCAACRAAERDVRLALVITTHERPDALAAVLDSVARQRVAPAEIVIADDGSGAATREVIAALHRALGRTGAHGVAAARGIPRSRACATSAIAATSRGLPGVHRRRHVAAPGVHRRSRAARARAASSRRACACTPTPALTAPLIADPARLPRLWSPGLGGLRRAYLLHSPAAAPR